MDGSQSRSALKNWSAAVQVFGQRYTFHPLHRHFEDLMLLFLVRCNQVETVRRGLDAAPYPLHFTSHWDHHRSTVLHEACQFGGLHWNNS